MFLSRVRELGRKITFSGVISVVALVVSILALYFQWFWSPRALQVGAWVNLDVEETTLVAVANKGKHHETILGVRYWVRERDGPIDKARRTSEDELPVCAGTDTRLTDKILDPELVWAAPPGTAPGEPLPTTRDEKGNITGVGVTVDLRGGGKGRLDLLGKDGKKRSMELSGFIEKSSNLVFYTHYTSLPPFTVKPDDVVTKVVDLPMMDDESMTWPLTALLAYPGKEPREILASVTCYELWVGIRLLGTANRPVERLLHIATFSRDPETKKFKIEKYRPDVSFHSVF